MYKEEKIGLLILIIFVGIIVYTLVGTSGNVDTIKQIAPKAIEERNWKIIRYEGFQYGSWGKHGGIVWYHVSDINDPDIQYRVAVSLWGGELQYYYGQPEKLERIQVDIKK